VANKTFIPTDEERKLVLALSGYGITREDIAKIVINPNTGRPVTATTLRKHFRHELKTGHVTANAKVAESLYKQATSGKNVTASIFWLKTRARWKETQRHEHTGANGEPIAVDVGTLTDAQLEYVAKHGRIPADVRGDAGAKAKK